MTKQQMENGMARGTIIHAADLFCGAGGSSTGLVQAATALNLKLSLLAINHWSVAVDTHSRNNPWARHLCADIASVDPNKAVGGGRLDLLIASPECTHHSNARGGKPCSDQSRASAWHVLHWVERLDVRRVLIENVREFEAWGPLDDSGRPDKARKGETFRAFISALKSFGYAVEWRLLNAADYGDATTRKRLFIQASKNGPVRWPAPTHADRWRPARAVIDWSMKGKSIFHRKRPLRPNTLRRIELGLKKFGGEAFLAVLRGTTEAHMNGSRSVDEPLPTVTAGGKHIALCEPFVIGQQSGATARSVQMPLPTIATAGAIALCQPFLTKYYRTGIAKSVEIPLDTITAKARYGLVQPEGGDIYFRMLQPHELAAAMGFDGYEFAGTKTDQIRQIGNAVAVRTARALCHEMLAS